MLMQTNPEVTKLQSQIDNCITLRGIIQRKIDANESSVRLNSFSDMCGTEFCILGDYLKGDFINWTQFHTLCQDFDTNSEFNIANSSQYHPGKLSWLFIFGNYKLGCLRKRLDRLNTHISTLEQRMANMLVAA